MRRVALRDAGEELAWLVRSGQGRSIPYAAVCEFGSSWVFSSGAHHRRLPLWLKQRCSFFPAYCEHEARRERMLTDGG
jgi:hypothetical protein